MTGIIPPSRGAVLLPLLLATVSTSIAADEATGAAATPAPRVDRAAARFQPAGEPGYHGEFEITGGYSAAADVTEAAAALGEVDTVLTRIRYTGNFVPGGSVNWSMGFEFQSFLFGGTAGGPVPDGLHAASVPLGMNWRFAERWSFLAEVSPGLYSDFGSLSSESFNAPLLAGLTYSVNPDLLLVLQLSLDPRRDVVLIGGPGLRWRFAEQWTLSLLFPRPRIEFAPAEGWVLTAGGEILGGAYQLGEDYGTRRGRPALDDVNMSYREIRAGLGVFRQLGERWRLEASAGWMIDRRWVVDERDILINGDGAPYARLSLTCRY